MREIIKKFAKNSTFFKYSLIVFDVILIIVLFFIFTFLRNGELDFSLVSKRVLGILIITNTFGIYLIRGYSYSLNACSLRFTIEHALISLISSFVAVAILFSLISYDRDVINSRSVVLSTLITFSLASIAYRAALGSIKEKRKKTQCVIFLGSNNKTLETVIELKKHNYKREIYVFDDSSKNDHLWNQLEIRRENYNEFDPGENYFENKKVRYIILGDDISKFSLDSYFLDSLIQKRFMGDSVVTLETFIIDELSYIPIDLISDNWVFGSGFQINDNFINRQIKRFFDLIFSLSIIILLLPILIVAALAVKMTSRGPIFFSQERIGLYKKPFILLKFRSMKVGAEKMGDYTQINDSRFTPIGKFIRKTRIDELPQLFNVIKGEMSLIGPRAEWIKLVKEYENEIPNYHFRHLVRPGISGWAQVNYPYGENLSDTKNKLKYDLFYIRYFTINLDFTIIIKTFYTVIFGHGR